MSSLPDPVIPTATSLPGNSNSNMGSGPYMQQVYGNSANMGMGYNPYGYNPNVNIYEQAMNMRGMMYTQRRQFIEKRLKENLPVKYLIAHIAILVILGLAEIAFQSVEIYAKYGLYFVGSGYWVPAYYLIIIIVTVFLINKRTYCTYILFIILSMFGFFISFLGLLMVNFIGFSFCTTTTITCDSSYLWVAIVLIVCGVLGGIAMMVSIGVLSCTLGIGGQRRVGFY